MKQARDYLQCSKENHVNFTPPLLVFAFYNGVTQAMTNELQKLGVVVLGTEVPVQDAVLKCLESVHLDSDSDTELPVKIGDVGSRMENYSSFCNSSVVREQNEESKFSRKNRCSISQPALQPLERSANSDQALNCDKCDKQLCTCDKIATPDRVSTLFADSWKMEKSDCKMTIMSNTDNSLHGAISTNVFTSTDLETCEKCSRSSNTTVILQETVSCPIETCDMYCAKKQFRLSNYADLGSRENRHTYSTAWETDSHSVLKFIETELLLKPLVDYSSIGGLLAHNEINFIASIEKVNLDVTALITLVSAVCHGNCYFKFREDILTDQAAEERKDPVLPKLNNFLDGLYK